MATEVGRIGVWCSSRIWPDDPGAAADAAAELEALGYQALWLGASAPSLAAPEAVLAATSRLAVATVILSVWDTSPAQAAAGYHRLAGSHPGRFLLGLGASHAHLVERAGERYRRPYSKVAWFLDGLDAAVPPVPAGGRVLAALGDRMLALAGQRTAGAHPYLVTPDHTWHAREVLGERPLLAPEQMVCLETDPGRAREIARGRLGGYLRAPNYIASLQRLGFTGEDTGQATDRLVDALVAWGGEDAIARRVAEHRQAGANHVCVQVLTGETRLPRAGWRALAPALCQNPPAPG
jgi:probable F420-dependent oxidoreductase